MYKKILLTISLGWSSLGFSQTELTNNYQPPQTVVNGTVRMLPGFHANSGDGNYNNGTFFLAKTGSASETTSPAIVHSPSSGENYVYSRTYLVPVTASNDYAPQMQSIQYFDGLGRPKQSVAIKASPKGNDLVTTVVYDGFGREVDNYLPVSMTTTNGAIQTLDPAAVVSYYTMPKNNTTKDFDIIDPNPFSHKVLENSPLDRIQQQIQVGTAWQVSPVKYEYLANSANEVLKITPITAWLNDATTATSLKIENYYPAAVLYKNKVSDEDNNISYEYKNGQGQTLMVRKMDGTTPSDTYYVYNEYDQLAFVISPLAAQEFKGTPLQTLTNLDSNPTLSHLCYQYRYDGRNRLVEKKLPGKDWEYMVYDQADRLILTQDANMRTSGQWLLTKYDQFGRVAYTGIIAEGSRLSVQNQITNLVITESRSGTGFPLSGTTVYYTNNYFTSMGSVLSVNYYDTYPTGTPYPSGDQIRGVPILKDTFPAGVTQSTKSLPTASFVKNIENDNWTKNYTFYDRKGRPIGSHSVNHLGGYTKTESELDFTGIPQKTFTYHKRKSTSPELQINERFVYNLHNNALEKHYHEVVGKTPEELLTENTYNEIGQLTKKKVGNNIQEIDYAYNIRGWMTKINDPGNIGTKLFAYEIKYNNPALPAVVAPKFNGNIAEIDWTVRDIPKKRYSYNYDGLNRLRDGIYSDPDVAVPVNINGESLEYDLNGNITRLYRNTKHGKSYTPVQIDNLTYNYLNGVGNSNTLQSITDATSNTLGYPGGGKTIAYDLNGNMTTMPDKGITQPIAYNFLNLPTQIKQNTNTTTYIYRADGVKLKKTYNLVNAAGSKIINTEYLDGFQYSTPNTEPIRRALEEQDDATLSAVTAGNEEAFLPLDDRTIAEELPGNPSEEVAINLSFFPTSEGYYDYENFRYIYQYKDHLGNVRISYVKNSAGALEIKDWNDYYPFGMSFLKPFGQVSVYDPMAIPYNYKYNGKELQETGMYDYGARMYMPDIGRWGVVDPLAELDRRWSPYRYAYDNPIRFIDPDGMLEEWVEHEGKMEYDSRVQSQADAEKYWGSGAKYWADGSGYYASDNNYYLLESSGNYVSNGVAGNSPDIAGTEPLSTKIGNYVSDNVIIEASISGSLGFQVGGKTGVFEGSAGTMVMNAGTAKLNLISGEGSIEQSDGRFNHFIEGVAGVKGLKGLELGGGVSSSTAHNENKSDLRDVALTDFRVDNAYFTAGKDVTKNPVGNKSGYGPLNVQPGVSGKTNERAVSLGIGAKMLIGIDLNLKIGVK